MIHEPREEWTDEGRVRVVDEVCDAYCYNDAAGGAPGDSDRVGSLDAGDGHAGRLQGLVYTRYRFGKMADYLAAQQGARANFNGFWSNDIVTVRSLALLKLWGEEAAND